MMEYLKRKLCRLEKQKEWQQKVPFPRYYEKNGKIVREEENGETFLVEVDDNFNEKIIGKIK